MESLDLSPLTCALAAGAAAAGLIAWRMLRTPQRGRLPLPRSGEKPRAILVTGCSTGIGRATAVHLARTGSALVFATVRKESDAQSLRAEGLDALIPVCPFDLSDPQSIDAAVDFVHAEMAKRNIPGLWAVVNNAGGGWLSPLETMEMERWRREFETRTKGRIVWVVTAGLMALPYVSSIHVPEWSAQCVSDTLDVELSPWGIPVIKIGCGTIDTAGPDRSYTELNELRSKLTPQEKALYSVHLDNVEAFLRSIDSERTPAIEVAMVVEGALAAQKPRDNYRVGKMASVMHLCELMPTTITKPWYRKNYKL
eukprot:m51a1_g3089 hypothetical protein (311) ;mRNA; f:84643-85798